MGKLACCLICGSTKYRVMYKATVDTSNEEIDYGEFSVFADTRHAQIVSCRQCNFVFVNPKEDGHKIIKAYSQLTSEEYLQEQENRETVFKENIKLIEHFTKGKGKLLDIGCSAGLFLQAASRRDWEVKGIEPSFENASFAKRAFNLDVINSNIEDVDFSDEVFNVVTMWDVVEHLLDPGEALAKIHSILDNEGIFVLTTPDIKSTLAKILKERWYSINRLHLYYFDEKSLSRFLRKYGFEIIYKCRYCKIFTLKYLFKKLRCSLPVLSKFLDVLFCGIINMGKIKIPINLHDELMIIAKKV